MVRASSIGASVCLLALVTCGRSPLDLPPTGAAGIGGTGTGASGGASMIGGTFGGGVTGGGGTIFVSGAAGVGAGGVAGASAGSSGQSDGGFATGSGTIGQRCVEGLDCLSGFCANGVCCATACDGSCQSCALPGTFGRCSPLPASTVCLAAQCNGNMRIPMLTCGGYATCPFVPLPSLPCAPYACDAATGTCETTCTSDADCFNASCVNGSCGFIGIGARCMSNSECATGFCADGMCCNVACQGSCVSCALPGRSGTCWPIDAGAPDPHAICRDQGAASCGMNGSCDGNGGCAHYPPGTICAGAICPTTLMPIAGTCTAQGTCAVSVQSCGP
jgi:hypothetical protein